MFPRRFGGGFLLGRHAPKADSLSLGERRRRKTASRKGAKVHVDSRSRDTKTNVIFCVENVVVVLVHVLRERPLLRLLLQLR